MRINRSLGPQSLSLIYLGAVYFPEPSLRGKNNNYCLIMEVVNSISQFYNKMTHNSFLF